jgi:hypothetical protein
LTEEVLIFVAIEDEPRIPLQDEMLVKICPEHQTPPVMPIGNHQHPVGRCEWAQGIIAGWESSIPDHEVEGHGHPDSLVRLSLDGYEHCQRD